MENDSASGASMYCGHNSCFEIIIFSVHVCHLNETKHGMNVPYEVLTTCCYFVAAPSFKMATSWAAVDLV